jgi:hypothetical protein
MNHRDPEECPFFEDAINNDARMIEVLSAAVGLQRLSLSDQYWLTAQTLESLGALTSGLIAVNLRGTNATDAALASLLASSPNLQSLDVSECQQLMDLTCIGALTDLREFRAANCVLMQPSSVASLRDCHRLALLDVSFCPQVDDESLQQLAGGAASLLHLELAGSCKFGDEGLLAVTRENPSIGHLTLSLNMHVTDDQVAKCVKPLKRLSFFDAAGCKLIGNRTCMALSRNCECLATLNLANTGVTAGGVSMVVSKCVDLEQLDISGCSEVTDETFHNAMISIHRIKKVKLTHLHLVTDETLNKLRNEHPNCVFEREAKKMTDPKDPNILTAILGEPYVAKTKQPKVKKAENANVRQRKKNN